MILTKRLVKGSPLTAQEGDANWTKLEQALNDLALAFASNADEVTLTVAGNVISIKALGVDTAQLKDDSVTTAKVADNAITADQIADDAITNAHILDGTILSANIGAEEVKTVNIEDGAVTADQIGVGAVTAEKVQDASVTVSKMSFTPETSTGDVTLSWADAPSFFHTMAGADDITFDDEADGQSIAIAVKNPAGIEQTVTFLTDHELVWTDAGAATAIAAGKTVVFTFIRLGTVLFGGAKGPYTLS